MSNKITTRDLISDIIDLETQIEYCKNTEEREGLQNELVTVRLAIEKKMKNLDIFDFELTFYSEEAPENTGEVENPGYPFTNENYNKVNFGSSANAFEARQKLAQKFGFDGYGDYRGAKSLDDRKADWDDSSDIW